MTSIGETRRPQRTAWRGLTAAFDLLFRRRAARRRAARRGMTASRAGPGAAIDPAAARDAGLGRAHLDYAKPALLRTAAPARLHRIAERTRAGLPPW